MTKILKIFIMCVFMLHIANTSCIAMDKTYKNSGHVYITIKDPDGRPMSGIEVTLKGAGKIPTQTTDKDGDVQFKIKEEGVGRSVADKSCEFLSKIYEKTKPNLYSKYGDVWVDLNDPKGTIKKHHEHLRFVGGCNFEIKINKNYINQSKYADVATMRKLAINKDGSGRYLAVCFNEKIPSEVTAKCVTDYDFMSLNLAQGITLANWYIFDDIGGQGSVSNHTCQNTYSKGGDGYHYLNCITYDKKRAYQFKFKSLNTKSNDASQNSFAQLSCKQNKLNYELFRDGVKFPICYAQDLSAQNCSDVNATLMGFNDDYHATFLTNLSSTDCTRSGYCKTTIVREKACKITFGEKNVQKWTPRTYGDINPNVFSTIRINTDEEAIILLNDYVMNKLPMSFESLYCQPATTTLQTGGFLIPKEKDIITCDLYLLNGETHKIDFVFDSTYSNKTQHKGGKSGMKCITKDGQFDGKNCVGVSEAMCDAINGNWDKKQMLCVLPDAVKADNERRWAKTGKIAAGIVGTAVVTVLSGGTAIYVLAGVALTGELLLEANKAYRNGHARDLIVASNMCPEVSQSCVNGKRVAMCNPDSTCSKELLINFGKYADNMFKDDEFNDSSLSGAVSKALNKLYENLSGCVDENFVDRYDSSNKKYKLLINTVEGITKTANVLSLATPRGAGKALKIVSNAGNFAPRYKTVLNLLGQSKKSSKTLLEMEKIRRLKSFRKTTDLTSKTSTVTNLGSEKLLQQQCDKDVSCADISKTLQLMTQEGLSCQ